MSDKKNCYACAYSGMEPDDARLICGHPSEGSFGVYLKGFRDPEPTENCTSNFINFKQHPLRNADGSMKDD